METKQLTKHYNLNFLGNVPGNGQRTSPALKTTPEIRPF